MYVLIFAGSQVRDRAVEDLCVNTKSGSNLNSVPLLLDPKCIYANEPRKRVSALWLGVLTI